MKKDELRYLQRLAEIYPTIGKASTEIINLQSILNLPKGTEHFMSDLHGEYQAFSHVLRNGSGAVRKKIDDVFGHTLSNNDKRSLATLIYYPKEKMDLVKDTEEDMENWYKITLYRLIEICKTTASKYTRSKVRKALPADYAYVIEELITEKAEVLDKEAYYEKAGRVRYLLTGKNKTGKETYYPADKADYPDECFVDFDMRLIDLFAEMDKKQLTIKEQIRNEYFRIKELLGKQPTRMDLFTYMDDDVYQMAVTHSNENPFKKYLNYLE